MRAGRPARWVLTVGLAVLGAAWLGPLPEPLSLSDAVGPH